MKKIYGTLVFSSVIVVLAATTVFAGEKEFISIIISCSPVLEVDRAQICDAIEKENGTYDWDCVTATQIFGPSTKVQCAAALAAALELQKKKCSSYVGKKLHIQGYQSIGTGAGSQFSVVGKCAIDPEDLLPNG